VSDGTSPGTSPIVVSSFGTPEIKSLHAMGSRVFFTARGNLNGPGQGIWVSDGTIAGTKVVHQVSPTAYTPPQDLTVVGDKLWFRHNQNLYVWSGSTATLIVGAAAMPSPPTVAKAIYGDGTPEAERRRKRLELPVTTGPLEPRADRGEPAAAARGPARGPRDSPSEDPSHVTRCVRWARIAGWDPHRPPTADASRATTPSTVCSSSTSRRS